MLPAPRPTIPHGVASTVAPLLVLQQNKVKKIKGERCNELIDMD